MLERIIIRNFKKFETAVVELGEVVVFIGPNNSGKTSAIQALTLWELGLRRWTEKYGGREAPEKRPGVTLNRRDAVCIPVPEAGLFWRNGHLRDVRRVEGKPVTSNVRIEISVDGITDQTAWSCPLEFDYANAESIYCRPTLRESIRSVPEGAAGTRVAYLPPMSGLAEREIRLPPGAIQTLLGEGRTAEVLRNLCHLVHEAETAGSWQCLVETVERLFGVTLLPPTYLPQRGELAMEYRERSGVVLDLSAAGRGLHQTLLLLAFLLLNPGSVVLLDEPDAHLEFLRQRQIYQTLTDFARSLGCQIVIASHSEVLLAEAAERDVVVAFVGAPHRINDRGSQVTKALKTIGFDQYLQAEQTGWALYLEGSTDLAVLRAFAETLGHPATRSLERPFVNYVQNQPQLARDLFRGLKEAKPDLVGVLITDRLDRAPTTGEPLREFMWTRREIENYLAIPSVLEAYAGTLAATNTPEGAGLPVFEEATRRRFIEVMKACIADEAKPAALRDTNHESWRTMKASDDFLDPIFEAFFKRVDLPNLMRKRDYHGLARLVPVDRIDPEIVAILDAIVEVAALAVSSESV